MNILSKKKTIPFTFIMLLGMSMITSCSSNSDPKDYYGTYYGVTEQYMYYTIELSSNKNVRVIRENGVRKETDDYTYSYKTSDRAQKLSPNQDMEGKDAIFIWDSDDKSTALVLWILENTKNNYVFYSSAADTKITKEKWKQIGCKNDPKDYYGKYTLGSNYVQFSSNGKATYKDNSNFFNADYYYGDAEYINMVFSNDTTNPGLIIKSDVENNRVLIFEITSSKTVSISNMIFTLSND